MLKQLILLLSIIYSIQCLSARSNIWWSRRNEPKLEGCDVEVKEENPSLAEKICGFCFAKCQQNLADCLGDNLIAGAHDSIDSCETDRTRCEKRCLKDKRTGQIAEENWAKVVRILHQYNTHSLIHLKASEK